MFFATPTINPAINPAQSASPPSPALSDLRFRNLLGAENWERLPAKVRARFAKRLGPGQSVSYSGEILACRMSWTGWLLAHACRAIGAPLPLSRDARVAAVVTVTEDGASGGQVWTRLYAKRSGFPQVIHSAKRFSGPTGLEELLGGGFGIALRIAATTEGIQFTSDHYFACVADRRVRLPGWLSPGRLCISHEDRGDGAFTFSLDLNHPLFGALIAQACLFHDPE